MQGLLSKEMLADLVINIINIVILFLVTRALVYKPVKKFLDGRKEKISAEAARTEALQKQAEEKRAEYEALLSDVDGQRTRLIAEAEAEAGKKAAEIADRAALEAKETVRKAQTAAAEEKERILTEAQDEITELAFALSEKIMGRTASDADARRVAEGFFEGARP